MTDDKQTPLPVIAGPTASGKSALAMDIAERFGGVVIAMDSMQVYSDLRILTARPSARDEARVPHELYGVLDAAEACSAARWLDLAVTAIQKALAANQMPILCGGTGLYLKALTEGLAPVPAIPEDVRQSVRARMDAEGPEALHAALARRDPETAGRLDPGDSQRIARALEVIEATGRGLADWQRDTVPDAPFEVKIVTILPPRDELYAAIDKRFEAMVDDGALEEVERLLARDLPPDLPAMKALGVPELGAHLHGEIDIGEAVARAAMKSRRYAKRQITWWTRQIITDFTFHEKYLERNREEIFSFIENTCLTG